MSSIFSSWSVLNIEVGLNSDTPLKLFLIESADRFETWDFWFRLDDFASSALLPTFFDPPVNFFTLLEKSRFWLSDC